MRKTLRSPDYARLVGMLIDARKSSGITQQLLADRLHKPQSFVAKVEGGERRIDLIEFVEITRALEIDPLDVLANFIKPTVKRKR